MLLLSHFIEDKAEARSRTTGFPEATGLELVPDPGPVSHFRTTWGPTQAFLTPPVTKHNQISLGCPDAPPLLCGHKEGSREGEGLPEQWTEVSFQKLGVTGPHHL